MSPRVVVIGDVMLDVIVKPEGTIAPTSDTSSRVRLNRGGSAANMAEVLAREGHQVTYIGACGDDLAAQLFEETLHHVGIVTSLERVDDATGVVVAVVDAQGQRAMMTDRGANTRLSRAHVLASLAQPFDHLHVSGYTFLDPLTIDVGRDALARANELGRSTSVDVCSVAPLLAMTPGTFLAAARGTDTLFANEEEVLALSGTSALDAAIAYLSPDFTEIVVTRGELGVRAHKDGADFAASSRSDHVVDTTGAGDAATGAYLSVRLAEGTIDQALEAAMAAASEVVGGLGSRSQSRI